MSFKVTNFDSNRKPILLVNNTHLFLSRTISKISPSTGKFGHKKPDTSFYGMV